MMTTLALFERTRFEVANQILCARCQSELESHQPDVELPERLLGTCEGCGTWYLIDADAGVMFALPDVKTLIDQ